MKNIFFFAISTFCLSFISTAQNRLYVNTSATGGNNGQSWGDAFTDLQSALQTAQAGDEVWVAEGTYFPTSTTDRNISFEPSSGVKLYGGFVGGEINLGQRDWAVHPVLLSGDIGVSGDSTDNSLNVMYLFQPDSNTVVDGFTLCHGVADFVPGAGDVRDRVVCGGGLYVDAGDWDAFPNIQNCRFWRNTAYSFGGGVMLNGTPDATVAPKFSNCTFEENRSLTLGGGVARFGGSWVERGTDFEGCSFSRNRAAQRGGGLYYSDTQGPNTVSLHGCSFEWNSAALSGGGAHFQTGKTGKSGLSIQSCTFEANHAVEGAAIDIFTNGNYFDGEATIDSCLFRYNVSIGSSNYPSVIYADQFGTPQTLLKLSNTRIEENISGNGVAFFAWLDAKALVENILLARNIATTLLAYATVSSCEVKNTVISLNKCSYISAHDFYGSEVYLGYSNCLFEKNGTPTYLSVLAVQLIDSIFFNNCTFTGNQPYYLDNSGNYEAFFIANTIMGNPISEAFTYPYNFFHFSFSFFDSFECINQPPNVTCGPGNLFGLDPMFRDTAAGDYTLLSCSPLIDAGSNTAAAGILTDLAGKPRILGGRVDIGAYEAPAFALAAEPVVALACVGDSNGSISVSPVFGCEPYDYDWFPSAGNGPELNGLPPGNYLLTVTDGSGRQILDTVAVASAPQPALALTAADVECGTTAGGSLSASVASGTAPFQYSWLPGAPDTSQLAQQQPGNYSLTVVDANGCQDSASASISLLGMLTLMVDGEGISCFGQSDGWLSATPLTGAVPFVWVWQGWAGQDSVAQPLGTGNYSVTVSDAYGCTAAFAFPPMSQPDSLWLTASSSPQTDPDTPNGAAVVTTTSGGTQPYGYGWSTGELGQFIAGVEADTYTVTVTDSHGCTATAEVVVGLMVGTGETEGQALILYPNPAADWLRVVLPDGMVGECMVEMADVSGRVLLTARVSTATASCQLDLRGLPAGSYTVAVKENGRAVFVGKVVKGR